MCQHSFGRSRLALEPRWLTDRELRAWVAFLDLWRQLSAGLERQFEGANVSGADYQVLAPLSGATDGRMRPRDLAVAMGWDRSRLAHQLRRMEQRGLVAREECAEDRRGTVIWLTDAGLEALRRAAPGHVEWVRTHFIDLLSPEELDTLTSLSKRIISNLEGAD